MKIKHIKQAAFLAVLFMIGAIMTGCEKQDSAIDFGFTKIYIPQSTQSGGNNLTYLVPSGISNNTYNFHVDTPNAKVNVFLGVLRTGKQANEAFTVSITTRTDTITTLIAGNLLSVNPNPNKPVVLLSSDTYTLPATVSVPDGSNSANFNLVIDLAKLKANYTGKKAALCVALSNPSMYSLNSANSKVVILIDVDSMHLP
jgi:hypothetical protein